MPYFKPTYLDAPEDLQWLRETHGRGIVPADAKVAVIYGNEDCPQQIEWWNYAPRYSDKPSGSCSLSDDGTAYVLD